MHASTGASVVQVAGTCNVGVGHRHHGVREDADGAQRAGAHAGVQRGAHVQRLLRQDRACLGRRSPDVLVHPARCPSTPFDVSTADLPLSGSHNCDAMRYALSHVSLQFVSGCAGVVC